MELLIESPQRVQSLLQPLCGRHQICDAVMVRVLTLSKAAAWHRHYSSLVYHIHAVKEVSRHVLLVGCRQSLIAEMDLRESVHGTLNLIARSVIHCVKGFSEEPCALLEAIEDAVVFPLVLLDACRRLLALLRRVDHEVRRQLADRVGAELNRLQLVKHIARVDIQVMRFKVAAAESTLTEQALRHGVHG